MPDHTFAICAYKDSPYLDACIHSLKRQSAKSLHFHTESVSGGDVEDPRYPALCAGGKERYPG